MGPDHLKMKKTQTKCVKQTVHSSRGLEERRVKFRKANLLRPIIRYLGIQKIIFQIWEPRDMEEKSREGGAGKLISRGWRLGILP